MSTTQAPATTLQPTNSKQSEAKNGHVEFLGIRLYSGWFRRGNRKPEVMVFQHKGDLPSAIKRFQNHCTKMDYRFCGTYPFVVDLDLREKYRDENMEQEEQF